MSIPAGSFRCMDCDDVARKADQMHWVETPDEETTAIAVCPHCNARRKGNRALWLQALASAESLLKNALSVRGDKAAQARRNMIWVAAGTYKIGFEEYEKAAGTGFAYSPDEADQFGEDGPPEPSAEFEAAVDAAIKFAPKNWN